MTSDSNWKDLAVTRGPMKAGRDACKQDATLTGFGLLGTCCLSPADVSGHSDATLRCRSVRAWASLGCLYNPNPAEGQRCAYAGKVSFAHDNDQESCSAVLITYMLSGARNKYALA